MLFINTALWILCVALIIDALFGEPRRLWSRVPHPVVLLGKIIDSADNALNDPSFPPHRRRRDGLFLIFLLCVSCFTFGLITTMFLYSIPFGWAIEALIVSVFIAQRSLYDHVVAVYKELKDNDLSAARQAVSMIVGRRTGNLDEAGVSRATIESLSENFSDGVIAPAFWYMIFGLPGLLVYKAVNTADSMIGHRSEKYEDFGRASAKFDDVLNLIPARLTGFLIVITAMLFKDYRGKKSLDIMWRDSKKHRSPNAGWPEAAMAGAIDVALAGPRLYEEELVADPFVNESGSHDAGAADIARALMVYLKAAALFFIGVVILAIMMI